MTNQHMTNEDKREFLRLNVPKLVITNRTEPGYVSAMYELYHMAKDIRFPMFIRNAIAVVFAHIEDGNYDAELRNQNYEGVIRDVKAQLGDKADEYFANI